MMKSEFAMIMGLEKRIKKLEDESKPHVIFKKLHVDAVVPAYQTKDAAGMDLVAVQDSGIIFPEAILCVPTGLAIELPVGYEAQVRPRSGLALKGVAVANSPGTIDADYRGEIKVIIRNHGDSFVIHKGDRIAQLVIARAVQAKIQVAEEISETARGAGGFGSTGA